LYEILDREIICHVGFIDNIDDKDVPVIIPMLYGRKGDKLFVHGHVSSGLQRKLKNGVDVCVSVAAIDALVYAHSLFHSSANYRSAICYGVATSITDEVKKGKALEHIVENSQPGRWADARLPNSTELKSTGVLKIRIHTASAKQRTGPAKDDKEDVELQANWAGILPLHTYVGTPVPASYLPPTYPVPSYITSHPKLYRMGN